MNADGNTRVSKRYVALDIHKHYCVIAGVNRMHRVTHRHDLQHERGKRFNEKNTLWQTDKRLSRLEQNGTKYREKGITKEGRTPVLAYGAREELRGALVEVAQMAVKADPV